MGEIKIKDAQRVGLLPEEIEGIRAAHFRGTISGKQIDSVLTGIERQSHKICPDDFPKVPNEREPDKAIVDYDFRYDIWNSRKFNRISILATNKSDKTNYSFSLSTSDYNDESIVIKPPKDPVSLEKLLESLLQGGFNDLLDEKSDPDLQDQTEVNQLNVDNI